MGKNKGGYNKEDITVVLKDFSQLKGALNQGTFQFLTWNLEQALAHCDLPQGQANGIDSPEIAGFHDQVWLFLAR